MNCPPLCAAEKPTTKPANDEYLDFNYGQAAGADQWVQSIKVISPQYRSMVKGDISVDFIAPGMKSAKALCWQQPTTELPDTWGHDAVVAPHIELDAQGRGQFTVKADDFPNGPMNVRILTHDDGGKRDICELQLYNEGGIKWNQGIPAEAPPGAAGMKLAFSDDFDGPLSISKDGKNARYISHKPGGGDFSGWQFADPSGDGKPFSQVGTYLKISASKAPGTNGMSGLIAPMTNDGQGFWAKPPCYLECRFTAQSAIGTWPAFWTITGVHGAPGPGDELDIVEAYGGVGKKQPNHPGYSITSHFWNQFQPNGKKKKQFTTRVDIMELGGKSYWSTTFHTYGVLIGEKETAYYFDNIEVLRHPTNDVSLKPHCFLINYAIGGISGWPIDLSRYDNGSDMYVDFVRVYQNQ